MCFICLLFNDMRDGIIDGNTLKNTFGQVYQQVTGHNIAPQLASYRNRPTPLNYSFIMRDEPDAKTSAGFQQQIQQTGWTINQTVAMSLWGHDDIDDNNPNGYKKNINGSVLPGALNDPTSLDYGMVHGIPGGVNYVQGLLAKPNPGQALNQDFLNTIFSTVYRQTPYFPGSRPTYGIPIFPGIPSINTIGSSDTSWIQSKSLTF